MKYYECGQRIHVRGCQEHGKRTTETKEMKYGDGPGRWGLHQQPPRPGQGGKEGNEGTPQNRLPWAPISPPSRRAADRANDL